MDCEFSHTIAGNGCGQAKLRVLKLSTIGKNEFTEKFETFNFEKSQQFCLFAVNVRRS
jgi:hypothetical protein